MRCWDGVKGGKYHLVQTEEQFQEVIEEAHKHKVLAVDTETSGFDWWKDHVAGFVIGWDIEHNYYIPVAHIGWETGERLLEPQLTLEYVRGPLDALLSRSDTTKYFWNAKFDLHFLAISGIRVGGVIHDGFIGSFLLNENGDHGLKHFSKIYISSKADVWEKALNEARTNIAKEKRSRYTKKVNARIKEMQEDIKLLAQATEHAERQIVEEGLDVTIEPTPLKRKRTTYIKRVFREVAKDELEGTWDALTKKDQITYDQVPLEVMVPYAAADSHYTLLVVPKMIDAILQDDDLTQLYINEMKLCRGLFNMEQRGVLINRPYMESLGPELLQMAADAEKEVYAAVGYEFNIGSPQQLVKALKDAGCRLHKFTKGSMKKLENNEITISEATLAADNDVLEKLAATHAFAAKVVEYRRMLKLKSTYVDGILSKLDSKNHLHTNFNQNVRTGRMSSKEPNIQNIDAKDKRIKKAFVIPEGYYGVYIDYSQIELRLLAHASQDPLLLSCYPFEGEGRDVHSLTTASVLRGTTYEHFLELMEDKTGHDAASVHCMCPSCSANEDRKIGKTSNFLMVYGGGGSTLQTQISTPDKPVSLEECYEIINNYKETYAGMTKWIRSIENHVWKTGMVQNSFGRYRRFPDIWELPNKLKYRAYRQAYNFLIQGQAADLFKYALVKIEKLIKGTGINIVNVVHDDVQFYFPKDQLHMIPQIVKVMEDFSFTVPIVADVDISNSNWAGKKALSREMLGDLTIDYVEELLAA